MYCDNNSYREWTSMSLASFLTLTKVTSFLPMLKIQHPILEGIRAMQITEEEGKEM